MSGYQGSANGILSSCFARNITFGFCQKEDVNSNPFTKLSDEDIKKPFDELFPMFGGMLTGNTKWAPAQLVEVAKRCNFEKKAIMDFMFTDEHNKVINKWGSADNIERRLNDMGIELF